MNIAVVDFTSFYFLVVFFFGISTLKKLKRNRSKAQVRGEEGGAEVGGRGGRMLSDQQSPGGGREEGGGGGVLARFSPPPSFLSSPGEGGLRRGLAEGRRAEKKSKRASGKGFSRAARGRVGERGGAWMFHWASETEGEGGREGETPVR